MFEQQCFIIKYFSQSELLNQHMVIIGVYQSLNNSVLYKPRCLEKSKIYKIVYKFDGQKHYKVILEDAIVYTPEWFTDNRTISSVPCVPLKQPNVRKSLRQFSEILDVKPKTAFHWLYVDKPKRKSIRAFSMLWSSIPKWSGHKKIHWMC